MGSTLLAALTWDPEIRGMLIVLTAFVLLPGSVYMLLATNTGAKLGFLLAAAGLTGWIAAMAWIWVVYGIGIKGHQPTWHVQEIVMGDLRQQSTLDVSGTFPKAWTKLPQGDPLLGDATATADKVLVPAAPAAHGTAPAPVTRFDPVFEKNSDYVLVGGYAVGGQNCWVPGGHVCGPSKKGNDGTNPVDKILKKLQRGPLHKPHYAVVQVEHVIDQVDLGGAPAKPAPDPTQPIVNVVMERDQGNLRLPSTGVAVSMSIVFALVARALHRRDKEIMAARQAAPALG
jgi:hypothetical protein